ncbi:MAG: CDP-alcohol phosphatidyltransferase family protein [Kofleriaceae bacterium]
MTVLERVLREAARSGVTRAVVTGDAAQLPQLPRLPIHVEVASPDAPPPVQAQSLAGDQIAGVQIVDEATRREASRALLQTCRRPYDGVGDRYVIRSFSLRLTGVLARLGATPNQVTCANVAVGLTACVLAHYGTRSSLLLAGICMFLQVVLDSSDGELARIRFMSSKFGMWLDNVSDDIIDNLFIAMLGVGLGGTWAPVAIAAAIGRGLCAVMIYWDRARAGKSGDVMSFAWWFDKPDEDLAFRYETAAPKPSLLSIVRGLGRRDLYVLVWAASCISGLPVVGAGLGIVLGVVYFALAVAHMIATRGVQRAR